MMILDDGSSGLCCFTGTICITICSLPSKQMKILGEYLTFTDGMCFYSAYNYITLGSLVYPHSLIILVQLRNESPVY